MERVFGSNGTTGVVGTKYKMHSAAYSGNVVMLKAMLAAGEWINQRDGRGNTPIMMALVGCTDKKLKHKVLDCLLLSGADVTVVNSDGDSTLHLAVQAVCNKTLSQKFIRRILDHGAANTVENGRGQTASRLAYDGWKANLGDLILFYKRDGPSIPRCSETLTPWYPLSSKQACPITSTPRCSYSPMPRVPEMSTPIGPDISKPNKTNTSKPREPETQIEEPEEYQTLVQDVVPSKTNKTGLMRSLFECVFPALSFQRELQEGIPSEQRNPEMFELNRIELESDEDAVRHAEISTAGRQGGVETGRIGNVSEERQSNDCRRFVHRLPTRTDTNLRNISDAIQSKTGSTTEETKRNSVSIVEMGSTLETLVPPVCSAMADQHSKCAAPYSANTACYSGKATSDFADVDYYFRNPGFYYGNAGSYFANADSPSGNASSHIGKAASHFKAGIYERAVGVS